MKESSQTFPATLDGLAKATDFLEGTLETFGCPMKAMTALMVAMDEIASNIVHYSGAPDFILTVSQTDESVTLVFSDGGSDFNPLERADPDITLSAADRDIGGLGLLMVKKMMDDVRYVRENDRNVFIITKKLA